MSATRNKRWQIVTNRRKELSLAMNTSAYHGPHHTHPPRTHHLLDEPRLWTTTKYYNPADLCLSTCGSDDRDSKAHG